MNKEISGQSFLNQEFDRRTLFRRATKVAVGLTAAAAINKINKEGVGVRLNAPDNDPNPYLGETLPVEMAHDNPQLTITAPIAGSQVVFTESWPAYIEANPEVSEGHRWGNGRSEVDKGYEKGVRIFDIDATYAGGTFYAEHGDVYTLFGKPFLVIDWNEKEVRFGGRPDTVNEVVNHIRSKPGSSVSIEYKRGRNARNGFKKLLDIVGDMPAKIQVHSLDELSFVNNIISERNLELVKAEMIPDSEDEALFA